MGVWPMCRAKWIHRRAAGVAESTCYLHSSSPQLTTCHWQLFLPGNSQPSSTSPVALRAWRVQRATSGGVFSRRHENGLQIPAGPELATRRCKSDFTLPGIFLARAARLAEKRATPRRHSQQNHRISAENLHVVASASRRCSQSGIGLSAEPPRTPRVPRGHKGVASIYDRGWGEV
jgi:hypothetical protein